MDTQRIREWSTAAVAPREAFSFWREAVHEAFLSLTLENRSDGPFQGNLAAHGLDRISVNRVRCGRHSVERTRADIRRSNENFFYLLCPIASRVHVRQFGRQGLLQPGECALATSEEPFAFEFLDDIDTISIQIPLEQLTPRMPEIREAVGINFAASSSIGIALAAYARTLPAHVLRARPAGAAQLAGTLLDLIVIAARESGADCRLPPSARGRVTASAIRDFIEAHLPDPMLSPRKAARSLGVSERSIHLALRDRGDSFMAMVRRRRLERVAEALRDSAGHSRRVLDVALDWGFSDISAFNRSFRGRYGTTPRAYARQ